MRKSIIALLVLSIFCSISCTQNSDAFLSKNGFGPVRLGAVICKLPAQSEGIYDCIVPEKEEEFDYEGTIYHLELAGERIATLIENEKKIHAIEIVSNKIRTSDGIGLHLSVENLIKKGGEAYCDNYGFEGILYKGMLFSGMELSKSGLKKAEDAYLLGVEPLFFVSDFEPGASPTQITLAEWYAKTVNP